MILHAYPRRRYVAAVLAQDILLAATALLAPFAWARPFACALGVGATAVLAWGLITLHFPSRVELDASHVAFHRYGRVHRFAWSDIQTMRVRRFLVRDRVLVRIAPSAPFRGRYWLLDGLDRFEDLIGELERRAGQSTSHAARI